MKILQDILLFSGTFCGQLFQLFFIISDILFFRADPGLRNLDLTFEILQQDLCLCQFIPFFANGLFQFS